MMPLTQIFPDIILSVQVKSEHLRLETHLTQMLKLISPLMLPLHPTHRYK